MCGKLPAVLLLLLLLSVALLLLLSARIARMSRLPRTRQTPAAQQTEQGDRAHTCKHNAPTACKLLVPAAVLLLVRNVLQC
jgi:hypothetical protein